MKSYIFISENKLFMKNYILICFCFMTFRFNFFSVGLCTANFVKVFFTVYIQDRLYFLFVPASNDMYRENAETQISLRL